MKRIENDSETFLIDIDRETKVRRLLLDYLDVLVRASEFQLEAAKSYCALPKGEQDEQQRRQLAFVRGNSLWEITYLPRPTIYGVAVEIKLVVKKTPISDDARRTYPPFEELKLGLIVRYDGEIMGGDIKHSNYSRNSKAKGEIDDLNVRFLTNSEEAVSMARRMLEDFRSAGSQK